MRGGNRPIMLYNLPELYNKEHCLCYVDEREIDDCAEETTPKLDIPCDETVRDLCMLLLEEDGYGIPEDAGDARNLYMHLRNSILDQL